MAELLAELHEKVDVVKNFSLDKLRKIYKEDPESLKEVVKLVENIFSDELSTVPLAEKILANPEATREDVLEELYRIEPVVKKLGVKD